MICPIPAFCSQHFSLKPSLGFCVNFNFHSRCRRLFRILHQITHCQVAGDENPIREIISKATATTKQKTLKYFAMNV